MGELWSIGDLRQQAQSPESQLNTALATINKAQEIANRETRAVVVIAFVHGWHNNASAYDLESTEFYLSCRPTSGNLDGQA